MTSLFPLFVAVEAFLLLLFLLEAGYFPSQKHLERQRRANVIPTRVSDREQQRYNLHSSRARLMQPSLGYVSQQRVEGVHIIISRLRKGGSSLMLTRGPNSSTLSNIAQIVEEVDNDLDQLDSSLPL